MKKEERLHRLFGDIDDDLVADAAATPTPLRVWLPRVTAVAAAVALAVGVAIAQPWNAEKPPVKSKTTVTTAPQTNGDMHGNEFAEDANPGVPVETAPVYVEPTDVAPTLPSGGAPTTAATQGEVGYEPTWEEKPIWQKFPQFERFEIGSYTVRETATLTADKLGECLGEVNLHGYDIYTETGYDIVGKIYRIEGIDDGAAVALQYPEDDDYFVAVCSKYSPATLGDLIDDLSLREHLQVGTVYRSYRDEQGTIHDFRYDGLTAEKVFELLLDDETLRNEYDEAAWQRQWNTKISMSISVPLLGYHNISISLSEEGYLRTNLLDTEKMFYIGTDKVYAFMAYVEESCRVSHDQQVALPDDTNANTGTTMTSPAQPPLVTGTTTGKPAPAD